MYWYYGNLPLKISTVFSSSPMPQGCTGGGGGGRGGGRGGMVEAQEELTDAIP